MELDLHTHTTYSDGDLDILGNVERAIELGGSTIKSYHPKDGVDGLFQIELKAYGKVGEKCPNCGSSEIVPNPKTGKLKCNYCASEFEGKEGEESCQFLK